MADIRLSRVFRYLRRHLGAEAHEGVTDGELLARFAGRRDEAAFTTLMHRHGPMVLGVCRRLLGHDQDTEDAVQATFLVLARKAGSIRKRASVGSWLYGVARRLALRSRAQRALRAARERAALPAPAPTMAAAWQDLQATLDEELERLPEKYRTPLILCYLEGQTHDETARQLGCPVGTVRSRVARARDRLRDRLARRGLPLSATAFAAALATTTASAALPQPMVNTTLPAALRLLKEGTAAGAVSPHVLLLVDEVMHAMWLTKLKTATSVVLALAVLAAGATLAAFYAAAPEAARQAGSETPPAVPKVQQEAPPQDPLPPGALARVGTLRFRVGGPLSPDGKLIAVLQFQHIDLMDVSTCTLVRRLKVVPTNGASLAFVSFSPDGKTLAVVGYDNEMRLLDAATGEVRAHLKCAALGPTHQLQLSQAVFSADGKVVAVTSLGNGKAQAVYAWEWATGKQLAPAIELDTHHARAALSPDGKMLATWGQHLPTGAEKMPGVPRTVQLWDLTGGQELRRLESGQLLPPSVSAVFSPDGKVLALRANPTTVELWDVATGKLLRRLEGRASAPAPSFFDGLHFSPDGKVLAVASPDGFIELWDTATWQRLPSAKGPTVRLNGLVFPAPGKIMAHGHESQALVLWDVKTGTTLGPREGHRSTVGAVAFTPGGKGLLSVSQDGKLCLSDPATGKEIRALHLPLVYSGKEQPPAGLPPYCQFLALSPDGKYVAGAVVIPGNVRLWETASGKLVHAFADAPMTVHGSLLFSPDSSKLASMDSDQAIHVWDVASKKEVGRLNTKVKMPGGLSNTQRLAFSGDGRLLTASSQSGNATKEPPEAVVWDVASGKELLRVPQEFILAVALSQDGKVLAVGTHRKVDLWRTDTGKHVRTLTGFPGSIASLVFSPDGRTLAGGYDVVVPEQHYKVGVWELATGAPRCHFDGNQSTVHCLAFSADSARLASGSDDTTVLVWDATGRALVTGAPEADVAWAELGSAKADVALRAIGALTAHPQLAVKLLKERLPADQATGAEPDRVRQLLNDLDSPQFAVRDQAYRELERLGYAAAPTLISALKGPVTLEQSRRIEKLLDRLEKSVPGADDLRVLRAVEVLERIASAEARQLLEVWAQGAAVARLTQEAQAALERLGGKQAGMR
jgi:RNA polymerase sigma factor (sigma-70 family)